MAAQSTWFRVTLAIALYAPMWTATGPLTTAGASTPSAWTPVVTISAPSTDAVTPHLSTGPSGDVFATWISGSGISVARRSVTNGAWSTPTTLDSVGSLSGGAQIVVNALGDALAVWDSGTLGPHIVRTARFDHLAGRWSAPLDISGPDTTSMIVTNASIAGDSTGNAVAACYEPTVGSRQRGSRPHR